MSFVLDRAPPGAAMPNAAAVSGETYSRLINLAGRRRFSSQRAVLYAVLAARGHPGALETSQDALATFAAAHRALAQGGDGLPGLFCAELREAHHGAGGHEAVIQAFLRLAERTHTALSAQTAAAGRLVADLVEAATPVLSAVNTLTQLYEDLGRRHARQERERRVALLGEIQQIAKQARIISFNAQVVAARAAGGGREFAVVATELLRITSQMDDLVHEAVGTA